MADLFFELVSPERLVRSGAVHMVVVPGTEGDFGVLVGHAPFMSSLRPGELAVYESAGSQPQLIRLEGGFAEVSASGLTVLAESAEVINLQ
ncbi:MAG: ATP synthase F1 subunit epsilon [Sandaracinobacteroides sp.]